jgi:polyisoprenoid-binding protein YceI
MKTILIIMGVAIIGVGVWYVTRPKPDASVPTAVVSDVSTTTAKPDTKPAENTTQAVGAKQVDNANVKIAFKGFGPDKVHNGSFDKITSKLALNATGDLSGEVVVDMSSLTTDNSEKLTPHLKSADFFDVVKYPTATFKLNNVTGADAQGGIAYGTFTIKGVSKDVTFPFNVTKSSDGNSIGGYKATFNINMKGFGIDQKFANEVVEVTVTVPLK